MIVNMKIDDGLFETYVRRYGLPKAYEAMRKAIETYKDVPSGDRTLLLSGDDRLEIEALLGTTIDDAKKLTRLVKGLHTYSIGGVERQFDAGELARIDMQAQFHGRTREQFIREMVDEIVGRMLERI